MPDDHLIAEPTVFLLFGATGDLAHRMVLAAFFRLAQADLLPSDWRLATAAATSPTRTSRNVCLLEESERN